MHIVELLSETIAGSLDESLDLNFEIRCLENL
jgi:hypothetical protein